MIDFKCVKLVIWDLDDTLWSGTLSEGKVFFADTNIQLIKDLTDHGIINSICSKNDAYLVEQELEKYNLSDYFVFKSINWDPKGQRILQIVHDMALRFPNVLFIDDNISNLKEVEFYCQGIMLGGPEIIPQLRNYLKGVEKQDKSHKRLKQYHVLEKKRTEQSKYTSNEDFLYSCNICVQIHTDCLKKTERLYELVLRTNQLNFTKKRPSYDEFVEELKSCDKSGYISVRDRFGDYGIVGFFLMKNEKLVHFLFSCRTIGQGIEQYVYWKLGYPKLYVVGDVAVNLDCSTKPGWIYENRVISDAKLERSKSKYSVLFKGPCDMRGMVGYLQLPQMCTEFTFMDNAGHNVENHNHSAHILGLEMYDSIAIERIKKECFFITEENFKSSIFEKKYDFVFLSTLIESHYGIYERKETGEIIAFGHYDYPLTDEHYWNGYVKGTYPTYGYKFTKEYLEYFSSHYNYIGRTSPEQYLRFLDILQNFLPSTCYICLILGSEIPYEKETCSSYLDRHIFHKYMNDAIKKYSLSNPRIKYIEITKHIHSQSDFTNNINHFTPKVYYELSQDILDVINAVFGLCLSKSKKSLIRLFVKTHIQPLILKYISSNSSFYATMRKWYLKIYG